ncbi:Integrin-linked protein kinase family [Raphanus sativus]|uniref:non-specific serine/threonine protein kinase n=1 Tax=Raphanus sativus TaxID=3726 RepID=A0A6J0KNE3_RAPSA|nr:integrin-linked protein kinase 1-like [Raphanus sativus]KAJ4881015.1 Integrin-linked protein kinase family [Raphanus sativus]
MEKGFLKPSFSIGKLSSLAPEKILEPSVHSEEEVLEDGEEIDGGVRLMYLSNEGDIEGIKELLDSGIDANYRDIDDRTALHVAACQGLKDVVELLLDREAEVDPKDRWGSTPLADAIFYKNIDVIKILEIHGAKHPMAPMHVETANEVPEYEINPDELDFTQSKEISNGTYCMAMWRGIQVAVKKLDDEVLSDEEQVRKFHDELALLQRLRHPNIVQFLGAVTQSNPMMIVTEYLRRGDLRELLNRKGHLKPATAVRYALDIARGMSYLHEIKGDPIIHRDLEPSNILRDDTGHLKVADFAVSKLVTVKEDKPLTFLDTSCRYIAPEVFTSEEYDTKADVFSFALIVQEMIEGRIPFAEKEDSEASEAYACKERPSFKAPSKHYPHGLKSLIEECWSDKPAKRPTFRAIIKRLESILHHMGHKRQWRMKPLTCFQKFEHKKKHNSDVSSPDGSSSGSHL